MSTVATGTVAVRLNLATITQYLSAQSSLSDSLAGRDRRRAVLLRSTPQWEGPAEPVWGEGQSARVVAAPSPLAVHELVLDHLADRAAGPAVLVVLTDREQNELDPAILARAHKQRIDAVDSWDVVRDAFGAQQVDPRLKEDNWAAEALLDAAPPAGWNRLGGGLLSRSVALSALALRRLRLGPYQNDQETGPGDHIPATDSLDTHALLGWSLTPTGPERFLELRGPERSGLVSFLGEPDQAGLAGQAILALVEAEHGPDAVPFGLVCSALWCHAEPDAATYTARGRAERWFGERPPAEGEQFDVLAAAFGRAAEDYVTGLLARAARTGGDGSDEAREARRTSETALDRASVLVRQFGAEAAAEASPVLSVGLEARFKAVGQALAAREPGALGRAVTALGEHRRAKGPENRARVERARMSQRLVQWLSTEAIDENRPVFDALQHHVQETGWVDRALEHIEAGGDPDPAVAAAYDSLAARVRERRREIDRDFARTLATWTAGGSGPGTGLVVENFLERVVKPVVQSPGDRRVLLLVLDGMSSAIATELGEELRASWAEFDPVEDGSPRRRAMAAALPTLTSVSRTSLFAGRLMQGTQKDEAQLFPRLPLWGGAPAAVFHKDDLRAESAGETFGPALTEALNDGRTHVAVVLNAIDDRLAKEQKLGDGSWQAAHIPGLLDLMRVAAEQGMAVLITSDHGHVVDRHGTKVDAGSPLSARHRTPGGDTAPAEIELRGVGSSRPSPAPQLSLCGMPIPGTRPGRPATTGARPSPSSPSPSSRFCRSVPPRHRHGGSWATSGPLVAPGGEGVPARGCPGAQANRAREASGQAEDQQGEGAGAAGAYPRLALRRRPRSGSGARGCAGDRCRGRPRRRPCRGAVRIGDVQGPAGAARAQAPEGKLKQAIRALIDAGGTLPVTALAQRVSYPTTRADGFAAILRQLLNYDGVQVLETLPDGRTVRLDLPLLRIQFDLD
ncbi:BREX-2 system phosphatase PglZ [Streptomyces sp. SBR177]